MVAFYLTIMDNIASGEDNNYTMAQMNKLNDWLDNDTRSETEIDTEYINYANSLTIK